MNRPVPVGIQDLTGGSPTGELLFIALPEEAYKAISDAAAKRGMTVAYAISKAINDFCNDPKR